MVGKLTLGRRTTATKKIAFILEILISFVRLATSKLDDEEEAVDAPFIGPTCLKPRPAEAPTVFVLERSRKLSASHEVMQCDGLMSSIRWPHQSRTLDT